MANIKKTIKEMQTNKIKKETQMNKERLAKKAEFLANNHYKPAFRGIAKAAKQEWLAKGNVFREIIRYDRYDEEIIILNKDDLKNSMREYVLNNPDKIREIERESGKRYRLRKKFKIASANVANGLIPTLEHGHIKWVDGKNKRVSEYIRQGCVPVVVNKKLCWQWATPSFN